MSNVNSIFQNYNAALCRDLRAEKLRRALAPYAFDGTETHRIVDLELRGLENQIAASNIRHANVSQYRDCVPVDAAVEVIAELLERGELV